MPQMSPMMWMMIMMLINLIYLISLFKLYFISMKYIFLNKKFNKKKEIYKKLKWNL